MRTSVGNACRVEAGSTGFILHLKEQDRCGGLPLGVSSGRIHGPPSALSQGHVSASASDGTLRASHRGACYRRKRRTRSSRVKPSYLLRRHEDRWIRAGLQRSSGPSSWSLPQSCGCQRTGVAPLGPRSSRTRLACASPQGTHFTMDESSPVPPQPGPAPENQEAEQAAVPTAAHRLRRGPLEEGVSGSAASMGPVEILKADIVAWQAWYEEQHDFPARLLRVLSQGSAALGGYATSWGHPEQAEAELQKLSQAGTSLAALLFFGSSQEKMEREMRFYADGTALLLHQLRQDLPLLKDAALHRAGAQQQPVDPRRLARLRRNLVSLLPFLFIVVNTFPATPIVLTTLLRFVPRHLIIPAAYDEQRLEAYHRLRKIRVRQARRRSALRPARSEAAPSPRVSPFWWEMPGKAPLPPAQQAALLGLRLLVWQWGVGLGWGYGYGYGYSYNLESSEWEVSLGWGLGWGWGWGWWL